MLIAGVFLRNYKSFYNYNFVPLIFSHTDKVTAFAGGNGSGKSTVLEAIDCILNEKNPAEWDCSNGQKKDRMQLFVAFLIEKKKLKVSAEFPLDKLILLSDAYWNADFPKQSKDDESSDSFSKWRNHLMDSIEHDKYYLICIGKNCFDKTLIFGINAIKNYCGDEDLNLEEIFELIKGEYKYIYIPVENKIDQVLDIKAKELHYIMGRKVFDDLEQVLTDKNVNLSDNKTIISSFNEVLETFLGDINGHIEPEYKFSSKGGAIKRSVKASDLISILINVFFSTRPLQKEGKSINSLSSGQKRIALIDVFTKIVEKIPSVEKNLVIAIDEPESSLDNLNKFRQFQRLVNLPGKKECQVLLTTHWYGAFLYPIKGRLNFLELSNNQSQLTESFNLEHVYDERKRFPQSIEMKSYFDLMGSIYHLIRSAKINWIICEGRSDAIYLKKYIDNRVQDLNIVAFNGFGNVRRLYELLNFATIEKEEILGKILFIIDTDTENFILDQRGSRSKNVRLARWHLDRTKDASKLDNASSTNAMNTVIEDLIDSSVTFNAAKKFIKNKTLAAKLNHSLSMKHSDISIDLGFLKKDNLLFSEVNELKESLSCPEFKEFLSNQYSSSKLNVNRISAFEDVIKFFNL